ncbi:MAG TPA: hypothetical protein VHP55_07465 [Usitatibacter sp.]|jgi:hypothetical protein|nr:hypothetical protein [Usitatibacter sp.]
MREPEFLIDAARVVRHAVLEPGGRGYNAIAGGVPVDQENVVALAVVERLVDGKVFLLHCNRDWETVAATAHSDIAEAERSGRALYAAAVQRWADFRELTAEEEREVRSTKAFLEGLAAEE